MSNFWQKPKKPNELQQWPQVKVCLHERRLWQKTHSKLRTAATAAALALAALGDETQIEAVPYSGFGQDGPQILSVANGQRPSKYLSCSLSCPSSSSWTFR